jgi:hypothetical protein
MVSACGERSSPLPEQPISDAIMMGARCKPFRAARPADAKIHYCAQKIGGSVTPAEWVGSERGNRPAQRPASTTAPCAMGGRGALDRATADARRSGWIAPPSSSDGHASSVASDVCGKLASALFQNDVGLLLYCFSCFREQDFPAQAACIRASWSGGGARDRYPQLGLAAHRHYVRAVMQQRRST